MSWPAEKAGPLAAMTTARTLLSSWICFSALCSSATRPSDRLLRATGGSRVRRPGGTVSGPTLMAMADFAMYVVLLSAIGPVGLAVTTNLNINFLRKGLPGQDVLAAARLLKLGKRLAVGEVNLLSGSSPDPIAHVTATYSIPNAQGF